MPTYFAIFTTVGLARLAEATGAHVPAPFVFLAVGDGGGYPITPSAGMTALVNERHRVTVNAVDVSPDSPNTVRVEGLIPGDVGGFTIREAGIFNAAGELLAVASYPPIPKPDPDVDGISVEEYIRILLVYENASDAIAISADSNVIIATRLYVDAKTDPVYFGDGSDGDIVLDGLGPFAGMFNLSGSTYTQIKNVNINNLTLNAGITLKTNGLTGRVRGTAIIPATAHMHCDGDPGQNGADGGLGGAGGPTTSLIGGAAGGAGQPNTGGASGLGNGSPGTGITKSRGGSGGAGGSAGSHSGGVAGAASDDSAFGDPRSLLSVLHGFRFGVGGGSAVLTPVAGGAGGGGGATAGTSVEVGGGGGGGGGAQSWGIRSLILDGKITCDGGKGGDGKLGGAVGGGGGGGGGRIGIVYGSRMGSGTITCNGGAGGFSTGTDPAQAGGAGEVVIYDLDLPLMEDSTITHTESGVAIFTAADSVAITFPNGWAYDVATGASGYDLEVSVPFVEDGYGDIGINITAKTTTGFTLTASYPFTGEVRWRARGA